MSTEHSQETGPPDLVGTVIQERYQIVQRLSEGGMGVVYRAMHTALQSPFAIKVLLHPQQKRAQEHFLQEARLASKINHPNTVYIADFGVLPDQRPYLAMEFLAGPTLSSLLKAGPMDPLRACQIAVQIARGLSAVHDKGIIHCDLKPDNVFVLKGGAKGNGPEFVKIVDFGIATSLNQDQGPLLPDLPLPGAQAGGGTAAPGPAAGAKDPARQTQVDPEDAGRTVTRGIVGTPPYMAPEQVRGQTLDVRVDQYALGCILYQMLAGRVPFDGANLNQILMAHIFDPVPPLAGAGVTVPATLEAVVMRLLAKDVAGRYPSMAEVEAALTTEIELLQIQRGEKTAVPRGLAASLGGGVRGSALYVAGRRVPLWLLAPLGVLILAGVGLGAYQLLRPKAVNRELRPGELAALRQRALQVLSQALRGDGVPAAEAAAARVAALSALGLSHDPTLRAQLEEQLQAAVARGDADAQAAAAEALGNLGDRAAVAALANLLTQASDGAVRAAAAAGLRQLGDPRGLAALTAMVDGKEAAAQLRGALLLCEGATGAALAALRSLAGPDQGSSALRLSALSCLSQVSDGAARTAARDALQLLMRGKGPVGERAAAAAKLADQGDDAAREYLRTLIKKPGVAGDQLLAARLLASPEEPAAVTLCRRVVGEGRAEPATRQLAAEGLAVGGELFDARLLGEQLGGGAMAVRQASAAAIVQLAAQDPSVLSDASLMWARGALSDKNALARLAAAAALADVRGAGALALLSGMMSDRDAAVRRGAVRALSRRGEGEALSALLAGLDDSDPDVREETIRSLSRFSASEGRRQGLASAGDVLKRLKQLTEQGSATEQLLAASTLLNLGDSEQVEKLRSFEKSGDVEVRKLLVEQARGDPGVLVRALSDESGVVRFAAARRLAEQGDRRGEAVLRDVRDKGGADALVAYGLLRKLGLADDGSKPPAALAPDAAADLDTRLAQIEAMGKLPADVALPVLRQASRDPSPEVRRAAIDALAEQVRANGSPDAQATLRRLLSDGDGSVRARAASALATLSGGATGRGDPAAATAAGKSDSKSDEKSDASDRAGGAARVSGAPGPDGAGVDGGSAGGAAAVVATPAEDPDKAGKAGKDEAGKDEGGKDGGKGSQAEQLLRAGLDSYTKREFKKAQRQLEKVNALCSRNKKSAADCPSLMAQAGVKLGQIHEAGRQLGEAMAEYQRVLSLGGAGKGDLRSQAESAVARLSPSLGQVITLQRDKKGKCVQGTMWLPPGSHMVKLGGKIEPIEVQAQSKVQVGSCP